jgi:formate C-acetyltransferase
LENAIDMAHADLVPVPFLSSLITDCIQRGKDVTRGGAVYNFNGPQGVGLANVADSLAAVKKLVFEDKRITLSELKETLELNFEGKETLRQMLLQRAPKYGNDDDYADLIARRAMDAFARETEKYATPRGGCFQAGMFPATAHISLGKYVGATPDGRKAGEPFADGVSPVPGSDTHGTTAVLKSVTKLNHIIASNGTLLNQKLHPLTLKEEKGVHALARLLRGYSDLRGMHIQFNVVDSQTLREAQREPAKYRNLVVRVAGWSAFFTGLSQEVQEDIIRRTEQLELPRFD